MSQQWDAERYAKDVGFVAALGAPLIDILRPRIDDYVLDLGCGDGALTEQIAATGCRVLGVDSSPQQIAAARRRGLSVAVMDGQQLGFDQQFDAVISNAALHWMRDPAAVLRGVRRALKPGGRFVAEMGGHGNVQTIVAALERRLRERHIDPDAVNPWYFPTADTYRTLLQTHGFEVVSIETFARPTPLDGDILPWLEVFTDSFFRDLDPREHATIRRQVRDDLAGELRDPQGRLVRRLRPFAFSRRKPPRNLTCSLAVVYAAPCATNWPHRLAP